MFRWYVWLEDIFHLDDVQWNARMQKKISSIETKHRAEHS